MDKILDFIVSVIEKNDSTSEEEKEEIRYGLEIIFLKALFWILVLATGIIMGCFWECVIYNILFFLIRSNAGGYHCYLTSKTQKNDKQNTKNRSKNTNRE